MQIRKAVPEDVDGVAETYEEYFTWIETHPSYTAYQRGVYPTRDNALQAQQEGSLYVAEENGRILGSVILSTAMPADYHQVSWPEELSDAQVLVLHLLLVRPADSGRGVATALVHYAETLCQSSGRQAIRLDTGGQNTPAIRLYEKCGFRIAARGEILLGGKIPHGNHLYLEKKI